MMTSTCSNLSQTIELGESECRPADIVVIHDEYWGSSGINLALGHANTGYAKSKSFTVCISLIRPAWVLMRTHPAYAQQSNIVF